MKGKTQGEMMLVAQLRESPFEVELVAAGRGFSENLPGSRKIALLQ